MADYLDLTDFDLDLIASARALRNDPAAQRKLLGQVADFVLGRTEGRLEDVKRLVDSVLQSPRTAPRGRP